MSTFNFLINNQINKIIKGKYHNIYHISSSLMFTFSSSPPIRYSVVLLPAPAPAFRLIHLIIDFDKSMKSLI